MIKLAYLSQLSILRLSCSALCMQVFIAARFIQEVSNCAAATMSNLRPRMLLFLKGFVANLVTLEFIGR